MIIQHNIPGMNAKRNLRKNNNSLQKNLEKLSSGFRINRSADDAAGLAISEKMRASISGFEQGERNVSDGISLLQTADGAMKEIQQMLNRMISLSTQAANDTLNEEDRQKIQEEIDQILKDITRIKNDTEFNGIPLFQGGDTVTVDPNSSYTGWRSIGWGGVFDNTTDADDLQLTIGVGFAAIPHGGFSYELYQHYYSSSSLRLTYSNPNDGTEQTVVVDFDDLVHENTIRDTSNKPTASNPFSRTFSWQNSDGVSLRITQKIYVIESGAEKYYNITHEFENTGTVDIKDAQFMFHADTHLYSPEDSFDGGKYFINNAQVTTSSVYTGSAGGISQNSVGSTPESVSLISPNYALPCSIKIAFDGSNRPDFSIGEYNRIDKWNYYDTAYSGTSTEGKNLGFSLLWSLGEISSNTGGSGTTIQSAQFKFGVEDIEYDENVDKISVTKDPNHYKAPDVTITHSEKKQIWIQASAESEESGTWIEIGEISCKEVQKKESLSFFRSGPQARPSCT